MSGPAGRTSSRNARACAGVELAVPEGEGGLDRQVADLQLVQAAALVGEPGASEATVQVRPGGQPGRDDPHGQRQEAAGGDHVHGGGPLRGHPLGRRRPA